MSEEQVRNIIAEWKDMDNRLVAELKVKQKVIGSVGYWIGVSSIYFNASYGLSIVVSYDYSLILAISLISFSVTVRNIKSFVLDTKRYNDKRLFCYWYYPDLFRGNFA